MLLKHFYFLDMQKFPLRMKDNDLLVTELYHDPSNDAITALSVYLTPKTSQCPAVRAGCGSAAGGAARSEARTKWLFAFQH